MLTFELVTLEGVKFSAEAHEIIIPTPDGLIAVFPDHMPLISIASPGIISVRKRANDPDEAMENFATNGGVIEVVTGRKLRLLADQAQSADDIDEAAAKAALERAMKLRADADDQMSLADADAQIMQLAAQLKVAGLRRRKRKF
jgi:F-type H+-transporting ATPase subunit epsilon